MSRLIVELQRRSVFQVAAVYAAVSFIVLQAADLTFPALHLSEGSYRVLVWAVLLGFPIALLLAWFFDLTPTGIKRATAAAEGAPVSAAKHRFHVLSITVMAVLVAAGGGVSAVRARLGEPRAADGRIALAVFPFRTVGIEGAEWSEGIADLLATALDGTEGVRVHDPWALWQPLRPEGGEHAASPDPARAAALGKAVGARRVVLGSVVASGERVDVSVRIYDPRLARPLETFAVTGERARMAALVEQLAIQVITRVWDDNTLPGMPRLEPNVTRSPDALKAYLAAKIAMRHGQVDSAAAAIDRAITLDSTFALALVDAVAIRSWQFSMTGRPYAGFFELLGRAQAHDDSLSQRLQLRLEAMLASVQTRGAAAAEAARRIIELDSTDLAAWALLSYVHRVYGWQYGADANQAVAATQRVLQLDSGYVPGVTEQVWLGLGIDTADARVFEAQLVRTDTTVPLARSTLFALRALTSDEPSFRRVVSNIATTNLTDRLAAIRYLRAYQPARAEALLAALRVQAQPGPEANITAGEQARLLIAEGRSAAVDSALRAPDFQDPAVYWGVQRLMVASALSGVGNAALAGRAAAALARYVPLDSALAYFYTRPAWWMTWLAGAYHAQFGDTLYARRAHAVIGTFPPGGSPAEYRAALQADIDARLAARTGNLARALEHARRAFELWSIHTENASESMAEPAIRFHLAVLLKATGDTARAAPLLRSLLPPVSWFGFYTARAAFELGELENARGDSTAARRYYSMALRLWERGGPDVTAWRSQSQSQLARLNRK